MKDKFQIDMCQGPLFSKILLFAFPLLMTNILQLLFHTADLVVIGHFASHEAMAAIGSTGSLNSLYVNMFIGLSIGANVLAARYSGEKNPEKIRQTVHTAVILALCGGFVLAAVAIFFTKDILILMEPPQEILPKSCRYMWICSAALPFVMIYNFGCAVLRAVGDTRRPFIYLMIAGVVNVLLNLFFVIVFDWDVEGVATATAVSHVIAAGLILQALCRSNSDIKLRFRKLRFHKPILLDMLKIGVPASVQGCCFSLSNLTIQSAINGFGSYAMAGTTAAVGLEAIAYVCANTFHYTAISFVSQNLGGRHYKRIWRSMNYCYLCSIAISSMMGFAFYLFGNFFLSLYNPDPEVIRWGLIRAKYIFPFYAVCAVMDVASGGLRGLGYSFLSMSYAIAGACLFRIFWVEYILPKYETMDCLVISYPVSWGLVAILSFISFIFIYRNIVRTNCIRTVAWNKNVPGVFRGIRLWGNNK